MKTSSVHSAKQHTPTKSIAFHEAHQNQTLTLADRESCTRIIPTIILCLVLDFQGYEKHLKQKTGCTRSIPTSYKWSEITSIRLGFFRPIYPCNIRPFIGGALFHHPPFSERSALIGERWMSLSCLTTACQHDALLNAKDHR